MTHDHSGRIRALRHLWECPFRPFFLLTGLYAIVAMAGWLATLTGAWSLPPSAGGPLVWHAHELLFGFASASIIGFLLTAVPEFTGAAPVSVRYLHWLFASWLAARMAFALSGLLGLLPAAAFDLAASILLLAAIAGPLWRQPQRRHLVFVHAVLLLTAIHVGFYAALLRGADPMSWLRLAVAGLMMLIIVSMSRISMRLVNDVLATSNPAAPPYLARPPRRHLAVLAIATHASVEFILPGHAAGGWLSLAAGAAVFNLMNDWHIGRALFQRWSLIPYLAYWFMALGHVAIGIGRLAGPGLGSAGQHLQLVGALGLSILFVMTVAGRLHSGRDLDRHPWLPIAALALALAALTRGVAGFPGMLIDPLLMLSVAAALWMMAWATYLWRSWHGLTGPRPDGRAGCDEAVAEKEAAGGIS